MLNCILNRETGRVPTPEAFRSRISRDGDLVSKIELQRCLPVDDTGEGHSGCVNTVNFDETGEVLVSGSDDQKIIFWNFEAGKCLQNKGLRLSSVNLQFQCLTVYWLTLTLVKNFSTSVDLIQPCSGSISLRYRSGHRNNVFQARILPGSNGSTVVSCGADGQVIVGTWIHILC